MTRWLAMISALLLCGCIRPSVRCAADGDCFVGEACADGECVASGEPATNGETCDLDTCRSELTAEVTCRGPKCVVLSCADGAALCQDGCCGFEPPTAGDLPLGGAEAAFPDLEIDPRGYPEVYWYEATTARLLQTRWSAEGWETLPVPAFPEPLFPFDFTYVGGLPTLVYTTTTGDLMFAQRTEDGVWQAEIAIPSPAPLDLSAPRYFARPQVASAGGSVYVCALYGDESLADGLTEATGYPQLWVARRGNTEWEAEVLEDEVAVRQYCSLTVNAFGSPHLVYSVAIDAFTLRYATKELATDPWTIRTYSEELAAIVSPDSIALQRSVPQITVVGAATAAGADTHSLLRQISPSAGDAWTARTIVDGADEPADALGMPTLLTNGDRSELLYLRGNASTLNAYWASSRQPGAWSLGVALDPDATVQLVRGRSSGDLLYVLTQPLGDRSTLTIHVRELQ